MFCADTRTVLKQATDRLIGGLIWMIVIWTAAMPAAQPGKAQTTLDFVEAQVKMEAAVQAQRVWSHLALGPNYLFDAVSVQIAYDKLTQLRSQQDRAATFTRPGMFLHLVKQAVMVNAAGYPVYFRHQQFFKAVTTGFDAKTAFSLLDELRADLGKLLPDDPNEMAGPVARTKSTVGNSNIAFLPVLAVTPYTYTIKFENVGGGAATRVNVVDDIDPTIQQAGGLALSDFTWGSQRLYPNAVSMSGGPFQVIAPGALAPTPSNGQLFVYRFSSGKLVTLKRADLGTKVRFIWTFQNWSLLPGQSGSLSFLIDPFGSPSSLNVSNPGAWIQFATAVWTGAWMQTNPWLRPGTSF